eukprot:scaffold1541_cov256-Pinguiococcus_pyrenoidosus.AAC.36
MSQCPGRFGGSYSRRCRRELSETLGQPPGLLSGPPAPGGVGGDGAERSRDLARELVSAAGELRGQRQQFAHVGDESPRVLSRAEAPAFADPVLHLRVCQARVSRVIPLVPVRRSLHPGSAHRGREGRQPRVPLLFRTRRCCLRRLGCLLAVRLRKVRSSFGLLPPGPGALWKPGRFAQVEVQPREAPQQPRSMRRLPEVLREGVLHLKPSGLRVVQRSVRTARMPIPGLLVRPTEASKRHEALYLAVCRVARSPEGPAGDGLPRGRGRQTST